MDVCFVLPAVESISNVQVDNAYLQGSNVMETLLAHVKMGAMRHLGAAAARTALGDTSDVQVANASGKKTNVKDPCGQNVLVTGPQRYVDPSVINNTFDENEERVCLHKWPMHPGRKQM